MQISTNPTQYLYSQALVQNGAAAVGAGQDVPGYAAEPATGPSTEAAAAAASTPSSQFSQEMLSQLIQAQTDQATGTADPAGQQAAMTQTQVSGARHGHGRHHHGGGGVQAAASTDPATTTNTTDPADPSGTNPSQTQSLAAMLMS